MGFWSRNKRKSTGAQSNKTPCHEYDVFVHTPDPNLTDRQRLVYFLEKVKEGRVEVYKTKHSHIIDDRRGLYIYVTHKSRKIEDVIETIQSFLESIYRDPEVDSSKLIRRCPRPRGVID
ncbi:uncharacterized protein KD926_006924 [Aspergillus affinis]|uniref:uncharacterized protein n=1 Tax=Aspergillus affinis TaxID=1070780 RepID=UPI0022FE74D0|nr:uncharacterized protein KD926_006924 [Aspergillus affinis]KAI9041348.1 hypothetical protein KD926_006924 [Aspergillus affinis]